MYAPHQPTNYGPQLQVPPAWHSHAVREPIFQVRVMKHTGALVLWINQSSTVTGTYSQCDAAIRSAQLHCLLVGWWSPVSLLLLNWIALLVNVSARKTLQRSATQAHGQIGYVPHMAIRPAAPWGPPAPQLQAR
ncbi:hypothetical protein [Mycobacterium sp. AZCC_0083]|uniref:hypothetical protein n=1 Tax=Mycobacterium sp. AZCC_0083 TaxID=2735882 RepID=UPI001618182E|nr:hypothetical protein [Mycobacterium sp. AZCC_0083]MBB5163566.1 hypothetical protein [Mycobacterium sp. AZCC_0083]